MAEGCSIAGARTVLADLGVSQTSLVGRAAADVAAGRSVATLIVGGEARRRAADRRRAGLEADETVQAEGAPDETIRPEELVISRLEIDAGMVAAAEHYALIDSARSARRGLDAAGRRDEIDRLWRAMARGAASNPRAWQPDAAEVLDADGWGRPLATPYHLRHVTQWNVDQAAAVVVTSAGAARRARVDRATTADLCAVIGSDHVVAVTERRSIGSCPAMAEVGRAMAAAGLAPTTIDHWDLYSCFPVAVEMQAEELGLGSVPDSHTGGMTFGGGPFNNAALGALVRLVEVVQTHGGVAAVTALSGMATKQGVVVVAPSGAGPDEIALVDVTAAAAAATPRVDAVPAVDVAGPATVAAATVVAGREGADRAFAVLDTPGGRTLATSMDGATLRSLAGEMMVGADAQIDATGAFALR